MGRSQRLSIMLSEDAAQFVRSKVSSGEYRSESEVIQEGLDALKQAVEERELWEREVLLPAHERLMANPSSAIPSEEVERGLETSRRQRLNPT
jgi:antitoxin ParD1/3/4